MGDSKVSLIHALSSYRIQHDIFYFSWTELNATVSKLHLISFVSRRTFLMPQAGSAELERLAQKYLHFDNCEFDRNTLKPRSSKQKGWKKQNKTSGMRQYCGRLELLKNVLKHVMLKHFHRTYQIVLTVDDVMMTSW